MTKYLKDAHYFYCFKVLPVHIYLSDKNDGQETEEEFNTLVFREASVCYIFSHKPSF